MTKQIEQAYRRNRGRSWLLIAAVVALAVLAIPIASGGGGKYYTLGSNKSVCVGDTGVSVPLTLTNAAGSQTLGSANITFPAYVSVTGTTRGTLEGNVVKLRNLSLAVSAPLELTVTVTVNTVGASAIGAVVKQANNFSGSSGSNLFELKPETSLPVLTAENCSGTISGKVWNDKDEDKTRAGDEAYEPLLPGWTVALFKVGETTPAKTSTTIADGTYEFTGVVLNRSYVICTKKSGETWAQTTPTTPRATECSVYEPNGIVTGLFTESPKTGQDIGVVKTVAVNCGNALSRFQTSADGKYTVSVSAIGCEKSGLLEYIFESYTANSDQVATFRPAVAATGKIALVEKRIWDIPNTQTSTLKYDDKANADGEYSREAMLYCTKDPRDGTDEGSTPDSEYGIAVSQSDLPGVLPVSPPRSDGDLHTSCLITSLEQAGGVRTDYIFSYFDGNRWL